MKLNFQIAISIKVDQKRDHFETVSKFKKKMLQTYVKEEKTYKIIGEFNKKILYEINSVLLDTDLVGIFPKLQLGRLCALPQQTQSDFVPSFD